MPLATITNEVMKQLPQPLRPNPYNIDDEIVRLVDNGWTPQQIVEYVIRDDARQPSHVVVSIRGLLDAPPPSTTPTPRPNTPVAHHPCPEHGEPCELCYCHPGPPIHHVTVPMPDHLKAQLGNGIL